MRDDFTEKTKQILQNRAGNHCSNPECKVLTSGPNANPEKATKTGVAAHISAAAPGGARYNPSYSSEQRKSVLNGIWLCRRCADFIDSDHMNYSVSLLESWKINAEQEADDQNKGRKAKLPISSKDNFEEIVEEGWGCPYCGTTVPLGNSVCLGCHAEVILGLTLYEREDLTKTGMMTGGALSLLLFMVLPNWLNATFSWNFKMFFGLGLYGVILVVVPALLGSFIAVNLAEKKRLSEPPRFFRNTHG